MLVEFAGEKYLVTIGTYEDGRIGEIFIDRIKDKLASKLGYQLDGTCRDAAVVLSIALQFGTELSSIAKAVSRDDEDMPTSIIGAVCDRLTPGGKRGS